MCAINSKHDRIYVFASHSHHCCFQRWHIRRCHPPTNTHPPHPTPKLWPQRVAARGLLHITTISDGKNSAAHAAPFSPEANRRRHVFLFCFVFFLPPRLLFIVINGDVYSGPALAVCTMYSTDNHNHNRLSLKRLNRRDQSKSAERLERIEEIPVKKLPGCSWRPADFVEPPGPSSRVFAETLNHLQVGLAPLFWRELLWRCALTTLVTPPVTFHQAERLPRIEISAFPGSPRQNQLPPRFPENHLDVLEKQKKTKMEDMLMRTGSRRLDSCYPKHVVSPLGGQRALPGGVSAARGSLQLTSTFQRGSGQFTPRTPFAHDAPRWLPRVTRSVWDNKRRQLSPPRPSSSARDYCKCVCLFVLLKQSRTLKSYLGQLYLWGHFAWSSITKMLVCVCVCVCVCF